MAELDEIFDSFACVICYQQYNKHRVPLNICPNNHHICNQCLQEIKTNGNSIFYGQQQEEDQLQCPICRQTKELMKIGKNTKLCQIKEAVSKIKARQSQHVKQLQKLQKKSQLQTQELRKNIVQLNKKIELKQIQLKEIKHKKVLAKKRLKIQNSFHLNVRGAQQSQFKPQKQQKLQDRRGHSSRLLKNKRNSLDDNFILQQKLKHIHEIINKMINRLTQLQGNDTQRTIIKYIQIRFEDVQKIMNGFQKYLQQCKFKVQNKNRQSQQTDCLPTRSKSVQKERPKQQQKPFYKDYSQQMMKNKLTKQNLNVFEDYFFNKKDQKQLSDFLLEQQPTVSKLKAAPKGNKLFKMLLQKAVNNSQNIYKRKTQVYQSQIRKFKQSAKKSSRK